MGALDSQISTTTGTLNLRAMFANPDEMLYPNQFVNARLLVSTMQDTVRVPVPAVQHGEPGTFVYLINADNTVSVRPIKVGPVDGNFQAVLSGLNPGDRVVTDGTDRLRDGAVVTLPAAGAQKGVPPVQGVPAVQGRRRIPRRNTSITANPRHNDGKRLVVTVVTAAAFRTVPDTGRGASSIGGAPQIAVRDSIAHRMSPSALFILRPVATTLLMAAILMVGIVAYRFLPISALPEVDYPTIQVQTFYPGASPEVMTSSVTSPLEVQFGQMPSLNQMFSTSSAGASMITLQFTLDVSLDVAEQEVQAAINAAGNLLPSDLPAPPIYAKVNPADAPILTLALTSKTLPLTQVEDLADTRLAQKISQQPGVGLVSISGGQRPAVRVQINPRALAAYGLNIDDLRTTLGNANVNTPKGNFDGPAQATTINANDQIADPEQYLDLVIAYRNGAPVRLKDVATVVNGAENSKLQAWANKAPAVILNVQRQPGANVIQVVDNIKKLLPRLQTSLPAAVDVAVLTDRTITIRASVSDVEFELGLAVVLVVLVIFLFLRNIPATIIPSLSVPLSLVGTLAVMYLLGFSLDNLSLMALTISTGFVVDDAIVMIENISRYVEAGEAPLAAALKGSGQIGFTIISLTVSLIAVLIPLLFMGDVVGRLFHEFAITLSVTIIISAVVSLTLVPMMCAKLLHHRPEAARSKWDLKADRGFNWVIGHYDRALNVVLAHQPLTLLVALATLGITVWLYIVVPKGFFPVQDTGVIQGISVTGQTASFKAMAEHQRGTGGGNSHGSGRR